MNRHFNPLIRVIGNESDQNQGHYPERSNPRDLGKAHPRNNRIIRERRRIVAHPKGSHPKSSHPKRRHPKNVLGKIPKHRTRTRLTRESMMSRDLRVMSAENLTHPRLGSRGTWRNVVPSRQGRGRGSLTVRRVRAQGARARVVVTETDHWWRRRRRRHRTP